MDESFSGTLLNYQSLVKNTTDEWMQDVKLTKS